jgi:HprK-related kinase A
VRLRTGAIVTRICSQLPEIALSMSVVYREHPLEAQESFADFHVRIARPRGLRRWLKPQVVFEFDGTPPFLPLPADQAFPILEWGLNWCISAHCHHWLVIHAAVVERDGRALLLPAPPGAGKSTLCAGLVHRGWRLLSDELALFDPTTGAIAPLARPISLKNASIDVIRRFAPDAVLSATVHDTLKGSVAHMKPPSDAVRRALEPAFPRWIVVPRYQAGATSELRPLSRGRAFMHLAESAFNYHVHGRQGFELLATVVQGCDCYEFTYGELESAAQLFAQLSANP